MWRDGSGKSQIAAVLGQRPRLMGSIDVPWAARHPSIAAAAGERPMNPLLTRPLTADQRVSVAASLIYTITFCNL
jgi:hypothetical protein